MGEVGLWMVRCRECGAEIDSHDSYADSKAMLRSHMENVHPDE